MKIINLGEKDSVLNSFIAEIRDHVIQKDSMRFRRNLERIGEVFAYEISKSLDYSEKDVVTPLGIAKCRTHDNEVVIASIMRAGLPLHDGILHYFDKAQHKCGKRPVNLSAMEYFVYAFVNFIDDKFPEVKHHNGYHKTEYQINGT